MSIGVPQCSGHSRRLRFATAAPMQAERGTDSGDRRRLVRPGLSGRRQSPPLPGPEQPRTNLVPRDSGPTILPIRSFSRPMTLP
jgi:hypothetical protein